MMLREVILEALRDDGGIRGAIRDDLNAILIGIRPAMNYTFRFCTSKVFRPCKYTELVIGCGRITGSR